MACLDSMETSGRRDLCQKSAVIIIGAALVFMLLAPALIQAQAAPTGFPKCTSSNYYGPEHCAVDGYWTGPASGQIGCQIATGSYICKCIKDADSTQTLIGYCPGCTSSNENDRVCYPIARSYDSGANHLGVPESPIISNTEKPGNTFWVDRDKNRAWFPYYWYTSYRLHDYYYVALSNLPDSVQEADMKGGNGVGTRITGHDAGNSPGYGYSLQKGFKQAGSSWNTWSMGKEHFWVNGDLASWIWCPDGHTESHCYDESTNIAYACAGTNTDCGTSPPCINCDDSDGYVCNGLYDIYYNDWSCLGSSCTTTSSEFKKDCRDDDHIDRSPAYACCYNDLIMYSACMDLTDMSYYCSGGACRSTAVSSVAHTGTATRCETYAEEFGDVGKDYLTKGTCRQHTGCVEVGGSANCGYSDYTDICGWNDGAQDYILYEYYKYGNQCYGDRYSCSYLYGDDWKCSNGRCVNDDQTAPDVSINAPSGWTNQAQTARVTCADDSGCDSNSYRVIEHAAGPGSYCPQDYGSYGSQQTLSITGRKTVCGTAKDSSANHNVGFTAPTVFKVDTATPDISVVIKSSEILDLEIDETDEIVVEVRISGDEWLGEFPGMAKSPIDKVEVDIGGCIETRKMTLSDNCQKMHSGHIVCKENIGKLKAYDGYSYRYFARVYDKAGNIGTETGNFDVAKHLDIAVDIDYHKMVEDGTGGFKQSCPRGTLNQDDYVSVIAKTNVKAKIDIWMKQGETGIPQHWDRDDTKECDTGVLGGPGGRLGWELVPRVTYYFWANATDVAFPDRKTSDTQNFTVGLDDPTPPVTILHGEEPIKKVESGDGYLVNITVNSSDFSEYSGIDRLRYKIMDHDKTQTLVDWAEIRIPLEKQKQSIIHELEVDWRPNTPEIDPLPSGTYTVKISARNYAEVWENTLDVEVDLEPPVMGIEPSGCDWVNTEPEFKITCTDAGTCDLIYWAVTYGGIMPGPGPWPGPSGPVFIVCPDDLGGIYYTEHNPGTANPFEISKTITCNDGDVCYARVCYTGEDLAGNIAGIAGSGTFNIDRILPVTSVMVEGSTGENEWYNNTPVTITLSCSDEGSGCESTYWCEDPTATRECTPIRGVMDITKDYTGLCYVTIYSKDVAGNIEPERTEVIMVDTIPPSASFDEGRDVREFEFTGTATDQISGVAGVEYSIINVDGEVEKTGDAVVSSPGDESVTFSFTASGLEGGLYTVQVKAKDVAGNWQEKGDEQNLIYWLEEDPPVTTADIAGTGTGRDGWYTSDLLVTLRCSDNLAGCDKTYYCVHDYTTDVCGGAYTERDANDCRFSIEYEGKNGIFFHSTDIATNVEDDKHAIAGIDRVLPVITLENTLNGVATDERAIPAGNGDKIGVSITLTDPGCSTFLGSCAHRNKVVWERTTDSSTESGEIVGTQQGSGSHEFTINPDDITLKFWAEGEDKAGNMAGTKKYYITKHLLANFITHDLFMVMGTSYFTKVVVRNMGDTKRSVNLSLDNYNYAWFTGDFDGSAEEVRLRNAKRTIEVVDIEPWEEVYLEVDVMSNEPMSVPYTLNLEATTDELPGFTDNDSMGITTGFPPGFPGMAAWAVTLLIALAGMVYWRRV